MAAIITDALKKEFMTQTIADIKNTTSYYYAAIGKSDTWTADSDNVVNPTNSLRDVRLAQYGFQSYKIVTDTSVVVPRSNWSSGAIYSGWDDAQVGHPITNFYVITGSNQVYVCLQQARNSSGQSIPSTVEPNATSTDPFYTSDGYLWKYLYTIGALSASKFLAANFMPVQRIDSTDEESPASEQNQVLIQDAAVRGQVTGYRIVSAGTGYETVPSLTVHGNGTGAQARAFIEGGAVVKVEIESDGSGNPLIGSGYEYASVSIAAPTGTGGTTAVIRPIIGPYKGFGYDPRDDLKATALMLNVKPAGNEGGDFIITRGNSFRQVALIKDPWKAQTVDSDYTDTTGSALRYLHLSTRTNAFSLGSVEAPTVIKGRNSLAEAYLDDIYDSGSTTYLYFHQTERTGFVSFQEGETIDEVNGTGEGILELVGTDADSDAFSRGDINPFTGQVLYLDNRAAITRAEEQTEDIKIVIQL